ncbi:hypothetical protein V2J09_010113 [Rumex salicifolius]
MDQILNKVGSYWIGKKANKELNSVGDDISLDEGRIYSVELANISVVNVQITILLYCTHYSLSSSIGGSTKWLVNKIKGKMQKPLPDLLKEYDIPIGIFPRDATHYEFDEKTGKLIVYVPQICEVGYKDSSVLRFSNTVTAYLEKGKLADIEGIKTKVVIWVKVTSISTEKSKMYVTAGVKKSRSRDAYEALRDGVEMEMNNGFSGSKKALIVKDVCVMFSFEQVWCCIKNS